MRRYEDVRVKLPTRDPDGCLRLELMAV